MPREEMVQAVQQVQAGGAPMSRQVARKIINHFHEAAPTGSRLYRRLSTVVAPSSACRDFAIGLAAWEQHPIAGQGVPR